MTITKSLRLLIPLASFALTSCGYMLDKDFHTVVAPSPVDINGELASLSVVDAPPEERTGNMINRIHITDYTIKQWYIGLDDAIIQSAIFAGHRQLALTVSIRRVSTPLVGFDATATVEAYYQIVDQGTAATIYAKTIEAEGTTPYSYAFAGFVRANEAINRGVQNNIKAFIADLEKSLAAKPKAATSAAAPPA